jgi:hypothetical protein
MKNLKQLLLLNFNRFKLNKSFFTILLLLLPQFCFAQSNITVYKSNGEQYIFNSSKYEIKNGNAYITDSSGQLNFFSSSSLDSITNPSEGTLYFGENDHSLSNNEASLITNKEPNNDELISIKNDLNEFRKQRSMGKFLGVLGSGLAIGGAALLLDEDADINGSAKISAAGGVISLIGFIMEWSAGNKINYDNDISENKKKRKK